MAASRAQACSGIYRVQVERPAQASAANVALAKNRRTTLTADALSKVAVGRTTSRGDADDALDSLKQNGKRAGVLICSTSKENRLGSVMLQDCFATKADSAFLGRS